MPGSDNPVCCISSVDDGLTVININCLTTLQSDSHLDDALLLITIIIYWTLIYTRLQSKMKIIVRQNWIFLEYWSAEAFTVTSEMCCLQSGGTWTLLKRLILRSDIDKRQMLPNLFKHSPKFCSLFSCNKLWSSNKSQVTIFSLSETSENSENS